MIYSLFVVACPRNVAENVGKRVRYDATQFGNVPVAFHRERLARPGLPVCKDRPVVALQDVVDNLASSSVVQVDLGYKDNQNENLTNVNSRYKSSSPGHLSRYSSRGQYHHSISTKI